MSRKSFFDITCLYEEREAIQEEAILEEPDKKRAPFNRLVAAVAALDAYQLMASWISGPQKVFTIIQWLGLPRRAWSIFDVS